MTNDIDEQPEAQPEEQFEEDSQDRWTQFGYALACLILAAFCFGGPSFFDLESANIPFLGDTVDWAIGTTGSVACYVVGALFGFFTVSFLASSFDSGTHNG